MKAATKSYKKRALLPGIIRKLAPVRPPRPVSKGPEAQGANEIWISRKTDLAAYIRRAKAMILEDG